MHRKSHLERKELFFWYHQWVLLQIFQFFEAQVQLRVHLLWIHHRRNRFPEYKSVDSQKSKTDLWLANSSFENIFTSLSMFQCWRFESNSWIPFVWKWSVDSRKILNFGGLPTWWQQPSFVEKFVKSSENVSLIFSSIGDFMKDFIRHNTLITVNSPKNSETCLPPYARPISWSSFWKSSGPMAIQKKRIGILSSISPSTGLIGSRRRIKAVTIWFNSLLELKISYRKWQSILRKNRSITLQELSNFRLFCRLFLENVFSFFSNFPTDDASRQVSSLYFQQFYPYRQSHCPTGSPRGCKMHQWLLKNVCRFPENILGRLPTIHIGCFEIKHSAAFVVLNMSLNFFHCMHGNRTNMWLWPS